MKIGTFCRLFGVAPSTVRYYVKERFLVPDVKSTQYVFNDSCVADMRFLQELKSLRFSLTEIFDILSLYRITNFAAEEDLVKLRALYHAKHEMLVLQAAQVRRRLSRIEELEKEQEQVGDP